MTYYNSDENKQVMLSREDREVYREWRLHIQKTYGISQTKGYLAQLLRDGTNSITQLKLMDDVCVGRKSKLFTAIGAYHKAVIQQINDKYDLDGLEKKDKYKFQMLVGEINLLISKTFPRCQNRDSINKRKNEIYDILNLKQEHIKGKWYVVHKSYFKDDNIDTKVQDEFSLDNITNKFISKIINSGTHGISKAFLLKELIIYDEKYGVNFNKLKSLLFRKIKLSKNIKEKKIDDIERFVIFTKENEINKINKELNEVFGVIE